MQAYSERFEAALTLAAQAHRHQDRKAGDVPYIVHPVHVSTILLRYGFAEDVVLAGLLHDVVEDGDVPLAVIDAEFGPEVGRLVAAVTERKLKAGVERPWEDRKKELLAQVGAASFGAVAIKAADALHSARALARDLQECGPSLWSCFSRGPEPSLRYYRQIAALAAERLGQHPLAEELAGAVQDLAHVIASMGEQQGA
jgi:(p)ppGpp synthase/HD superfamily hydrolase